MVMADLTSVYVEVIDLVHLVSYHGEILLHRDFSVSINFSENEQIVIQVFKHDSSKVAPIFNRLK